MDIAAISPSMLPHLACCRCYQPGTVCTAAAKRGTTIDKAIRDTWQARQGLTLFSESLFLDGLTPKDRRAVDWALEMMERLNKKNGGPVYTEGPTVQAAPACPGMSGGTMDAVQPEKHILLDFKTGQSRDYRPQMAAYAAACMETYGADQWTACVLYVDLQKVETYRFSKESALGTVTAILESPETPTPGEHCRWCALKNCPRRKSTK